MTDKDTDAAGTSAPASANLNSWYTAVNQVKTLQDLEQLFESKKAQIAGNQEIINLFSTRKLQLN